MAALTAPCGVRHITRAPQSVKVEITCQRSAGARGLTPCCCAQVEEVVTAFAPACNDGKGIFEITFAVATPAQEW